MGWNRQVILITVIVTIINKLLVAIIIILAIIYLAIRLIFMEKESVRFLFLGFQRVPISIDLNAKNT